MSNKKQDSDLKKENDKKHKSEECECCDVKDECECKCCEDLKKELDAEKYQKMVVLADLVNFRKRMDKEREEIHTQANRRILLHITDVIDDIHRAMEDKKEDDVLNMLLNKLGSILKDYSLEEIKCSKGSQFDPELMEAVTAVNAEKEEDKNKVVDVISSGYRNTINGQVFKSAKVIIAR